MERHPDDHEPLQRGLAEIARSILDRGSDYIDARLELAKLETEEAADHVRGLTTRLGIGAFAITAGYTLALVAGVSFLAKYMKMGWELPALIVAVIHLGIGGLFLLGARRQAKLTPELYRSTRSELTNDQQWLRTKSGSDRAQS